MRVFAEFYGNLTEFAMFGKSQWRRREVSLRVSLLFIMAGAGVMGEKVRDLVRAFFIPGLNFSLSGNTNEHVMKTEEIILYL